MFRENEPTEVNPEEERGEPTLQELIEVCVEAGIGVDEFRIFGEDDFPEALSYAYTRLLEMGEDPDVFLSEKGILE